MNVPAKHAARFINGYAFKPEDWGDLGRPIIRIAQLTGGEFDNYFGGHALERYHVEDGDLLFSWSATIDSFIWNRGSALLNQHIFKVIPEAGVSRHFLFYALKHYSQMWADLDAHGSTMRHIKRESLSNGIYLPDSLTQTSIANFLDRETARIDQLIEKKRRVTNLLNERWTALLFGGVSKGFDQDAQMKDSGWTWIGDCPVHWAIRSIRSITLEHRQGFYSPEGYVLNGLPLARISDIRPFGRLSFADCPRVRPATSVREFLLKRGDFLFARTGGAGLFAVVGDLPEDSMYASYLIRFRFSPDADPEFLRYYFLSRCFLDGVADSIHGGVNQNIHAENIKNQRIALPPLSEQRVIAERLQQEQRRMERMFSSIEQTVSLLQECRSALITAAVTGQIDVATWGKRGETDRRLEAIEHEFEAEREEAAV